jgi:hypothetical protein
MNNCPICQRPFGAKTEEHHLIPKTRKGKELVTLHPVCHRKLHSAITEKEMEKYYHTIPRLLEHTEVQKFIVWVKNKEPDFYSSSNESTVRKGKRRR